MSMAEQISKLKEEAWAAAATADCHRRGDCRIGRQLVAGCRHEWKTYREQGMYGEKYTYCVKCGADRWTLERMHLDML